jgi:hypothetical protein
MLVITGPTGQIGSQLLAHLLTGDCRICHRLDPHG